MNRPKNQLTLSALMGLLLTTTLFVVPNRASACTVPVFRYALEMWQSDLYVVEIRHSGTLSRNDQAIIDYLRKHERVPDDESGHTNFHVRVTDVQPQKLERPTMVLRFPIKTRITGEIWRGDLTLANATALITSPARKEIARRILSGETAVWVLLQSDDEEVDKKATAILQKELKTAQAELKLPELAPVDAARDAPEDLPEMRVAFSTMVLSREDPAESILIANLLRTESDLLTFDDEPIAFPVFGQGRALFALVGKGIVRDNIQEACEYLTAACSCIAKRQNPGVDLLMTAVWWSKDQTSAIREIKLPELTGVALASPTKGTPVPDAVVLQEKPGERSTLLRNVIIALVGLAAAVLAVSVVVMKRGESKQ